MTHQPDADTTATRTASAAPLLDALFAAVLLSIGGIVLVNLEAGPEAVIVASSLFTVPGLYLLIAAGVAHGIELSQR